MSITTIRSMAVVRASETVPRLSRLRGGNPVVAVAAREARIAANEGLFRELNEQIEWLSGDERRLTIVCECGTLDCDERLTVSAVTYEDVRSDGTLFVIVPGHEFIDVEEIVHRAEAYAVVRKRPGLPAAIAKQTDPRS